jgi:FSR family fosmidomycin resistance protein-like MFS transporter
MAPWFGRRRVLVWSFALLGPLIVLLLLAQQSWLALLLLIPVGVVAFAPFSVMVVLGHEYLPARVGTSSGVTFGLAVTVGGVFAPLLGKFADHHGLPAMFLILAALPLFAWLLSVSLPSHSSPTKEQAQPASAAS